MNHNLAKIQNILDSVSYSGKLLTPVEFAEKHRVLDSVTSSSAPGRFRSDRNPYFNDIVNHLMPYDAVNKVTVMKGAQIGASTCIIQNGILWVICESPGNTWLTVGHSDLVKSAMDKLDVMLDGAGKRHLIRPHAKKKKNQSSGDTAKEKQFAGGTLKVSEVNNADKIRQDSFNYGFFDDFESLPRATSKAGDTVGKLDQRFASNENTRKIYYISTPELKGHSNIEEQFLRGDQRYYFLTCPNKKCRKEFHLEWQVEGFDGNKAGIVWRVDKDGLLIKGSVRHRCKHCGHEIKNGDKFKLIRNGRWHPTAQAQEENFVSYHINSLYGASSMYTWETYVKRFMSSIKNGVVDKAMRQSFHNEVLGLTWQEQGESPKASALEKNSGRYKPGIIPDLLCNKDGNGDIILITCACDLNSNLTDDARLDYEVTAWCSNGSSYSIDQGSIGTFKPAHLREQDPDYDKDRKKWSYRMSHPSSVWKEFDKILTKTYTSESGFDFSVDACGVDTGMHTQYANHYITDRTKSEDFTVHVFGVKGHGKTDYNQNTDKRNFKNELNNSYNFILQVNKLKDELAERMKLKWSDTDTLDQPAGYMNFPKSINGKYTRLFYEQYEAEHRIRQKDKLGAYTGIVMWDKRTQKAQNHFWDCAVYNTAVRDIVAYKFCRSNKLPATDFNTFAEHMILELGIVK